VQSGGMRTITHLRQGSYEKHMSSSQRKAYLTGGGIGSLAAAAGVMSATNNTSITPKTSAAVLKGDIEAALKHRAQADARKISVDVDGADVTLTGNVHTWSERELARNSAWGSPGVRNVVDNTTVVF
jgi:osmotically-inducible protein OsmY